VLLQHNGLHLDIRIDRTTPIGKTDAAGVSDLVVEAALSTILDLEDSVAVVDADDKVLAYRNWLGILQGTLTESVTKDGKTFTRGLNPDREYTSPQGKPVTLHGRSLMFVRNVGHLMTNPAVLYTAADGSTKEIPEGILDAVVTTAIAIHDLKRKGKAGIKNSRKGSVYIVKPKMHGPAEVAFADELFQPRRKSAGPAGQHRQARHHGRRAPHQRQPQGLHRRRLQPRGLYQHRLPGPHRRRDAHRHAGRPDDPQGQHENQPWLSAYERSNVLVGLACGLRGRAQIGKGMWAMPDLMADMLKAKDRAPASRRQHRLGALAHGRDAARAALPPGQGRRCKKTSRRRTT
jgi:malate synthase